MDGCPQAVRWPSVQTSAWLGCLTRLVLHATGCSCVYTVYAPVDLCEATYARNVWWNALLNDQKEDCSPSLTALLCCELHIHYGISSLNTFSYKVWTQCKLSGDV